MRRSVQESANDASAIRLSFQNINARPPGTRTARGAAIAAESAPVECGELLSSSRRDVLRGAVALSAAMATTSWGDVFANVDGAGAPVQGYGPLQSDPQRLLDLPHGFSYHVISRVGEAMDDGLRVPGLADGMHAFAVGENTVLVRNHELNVGAREHAFSGQRAIAADVAAKMYDPALGTGGTTTVILSADGLQVRRQFLSLAGTLRNCAGGATPWGSWLSCEESVVEKGQHGALRDHGYAFEVPAAAQGLVKAKPLSAMGRFHREAVAIDPNTGIVYQSEDRPDGLFYRFIPSEPGKLAAGGRLQAMLVEGFEGATTSNHLTQRLGIGGLSPVVPAGQKLRVRWVDIDEPESANDDLRERGRVLGASVFTRGEGLALQRCDTGPCIWFVCTEGGPRRLGQIWRFEPRRSGDTMELFLEPSQASMMRHGDNLAMAPNGDVLVCEDRPDQQRLIGVTAKGGLYVLARNPRDDSELAGACFAPPTQGVGKGVLYVNIQHRGLTLAITGPWMDRDAGLSR